MENRGPNVEQETILDFDHDIPDPEVLKEIGLGNIRSVVDLRELFRSNPGARFTLLRHFTAIDNNKNGRLLAHLSHNQTGEEFLAEENPPFAGAFRRINNYELTTHDEAAVRTGLITLKKILAECAPNQLPTAFLYPDTAARPLRAAVQPILRAIYEHTGKPLPQQLFIATHMRALNEVMAAGREELTRLYTEEPELIQETKEDLTLMASRVNEIIGAARLNEATPIMFIDDYATARRNTGGRICALFRSQIPNIPITGFAFLGRQAAVQQYYDDYVGAVDTREMPFGINPGFDYRTDPDVLLAVTGVRKIGESSNLMHSDRLDPEKDIWLNPTVAIEFRKQMEAIGQEIASASETIA